MFGSAHILLSMLRLRRTMTEPRVEIVPLLDVIFLVLTFFIYAMVLMIPARVMPMRLQAMSGGGPGERVPAVSISIDSQGDIFVDREPTALGDVLGRVLERTGDDPNHIVYIAPAELGSTDRLPVFIKLYEQLSGAGLNLRLVGRPAGDD